MRLSSLAIGILAIVGLFLVLGSLSGVIPSRVHDEISSRGLEQGISRLGLADRKLKRAIDARLFGVPESDREIDLDNPTEADFQFLRQVFEGGERAPRMSAAKVLVEIQEPRAVGMLARGGEDPEEQAIYCSGALDVLRMQTRARASELMLDVLEDTEHPATSVCRPLLEEKLDFISGRSEDLLPQWLESRSVRVRRYALQHLPEPSGGEGGGEASPELMSAVTRIAERGAPDESALARAWLERFGGSAR